MPTCSDAKVRRILMLQIGQSAPTLKSASRAAAVREGPRTNYFIFHIRILGFYNLHQLLALDIYEGRLFRSNWTKTKKQKRKCIHKTPQVEADPLKVPATSRGEVFWRPKANTKTQNEKQILNDNPKRIPKVC